MPLDTNYDFILTVDGNNTGLLLAEDANTGEKMWGEGFAPAIAPQVRTDAFSLSHVSPEIEVLLTWENWTDGAGFQDDDGGLQTPSARYNYSQGVDASWQEAGLMLAFQRQDSSGISAAPARFFRNSLGVFALAEDDIFEWNTSTLTWDTRDSGGGVNYSDMAELNGVLYAARVGGTTYKYSADGITWTTFSDETNDLFVFFATRDDVLWGIEPTGLIKNTTNGINGGSGVAWSAGDQVGSTSDTVSGFVEADDNLYIFKDTGIWRYTGTATAPVWTSEYVLSNNGDQPFRWVDGVVRTTYGDRLLGFDPVNGATAAPFTVLWPPPQMVGNEETTGTITAIGGDLRNMYIAVKNGAGNTYIQKFSHGAWHTTMYLGANDCDTLLVVGPGDFHDTNPVLLFGYGATVKYFILPRSGFDPSNDKSCKFDITGGTLFTSWSVVGSQAFPKWLNRIDMETRQTTAGIPITGQYEVDESGTAVTLVTANSPGRANGKTSSEVEFTRVRGLMKLESAVASTTPRLLGTVLHATQNPPRKRMWQPVVKVGENLETRGGNRDKQSAAVIKNRLFTAPNAFCQLTDRDGNVYQVRVLDVQNQGLIELKQGNMRRDEERLALTIVEITTISIADRRVMQWGRDTWGGGKVWG